MKNINILQTSQPSNLLLCIKSYTEHKNTPAEDSENKGNFRLGIGIYHNTEFYETQNIYITNSEEIKEGDWVLGDFPDNPIGKVISKYGQEFTAQSLNGNKYGLAEYDSKKIILTTDQYLIKDGVQAIDDEFLEWFVKNQSCESVETILWISDEDDIDEYYDSPDEYPSYYEIIIPKEEPCTCIDECLGYLTKTCKRIEEGPKQETPNELESVLAKITHQNCLGLSQWYEVVYYDNGWYSYAGSKTFQDGEQVIEWVYCKNVLN
jgi:hypothetical protein